MEEMKIVEAIEDNIELLYKLNRCGVKNIATAIDYATIYHDYIRQKHIKSIAERKKIIATRFKTSISTIEKAICLMERNV